MASTIAIPPPFCSFRGKETLLRNHRESSIFSFGGEMFFMISSIGIFLAQTCRGVWIWSPLSMNLKLLIIIDRPHEFIGTKFISMGWRSTIGLSSLLLNGSGIWIGPMPP